MSSATPATPESRSSLGAFSQQSPLTTVRAYPSRAVGVGRARDGLGNGVASDNTPSRTRATHHATSSNASSGHASSVASHSKMNNASMASSSMAAASLNASNRSGLGSVIAPRQRDLPHGTAQGPPAASKSLRKITGILDDMQRENIDLKIQVAVLARDSARSEQLHRKENAQLKLRVDTLQTQLDAFHRILTKALPQLPPAQVAAILSDANILAPTGQSSHEYEAPHYRDGASVRFRDATEAIPAAINQENSLAEILANLSDFDPDRSDDSYDGFVNGADETVYIDALAPEPSILVDLRHAAEGSVGVEDAYLANNSQGFLDLMGHRHRSHFSAPTADQASAVLDDGDGDDDDDTGPRLRDDVEECDEEVSRVLESLSLEGMRPSAAATSNVGASEAHPANRVRRAPAEGSVRSFEEEPSLTWDRILQDVGSMDGGDLFRERLPFLAEEESSAVPGGDEEMSFYMATRHLDGDAPGSTGNRAPSNLQGLRPGRSGSGIPMSRGRMTRGRGRIHTMVSSTSGGASPSWTLANGRNPTSLSISSMAILPRNIAQFREMAGISTSSAGHGSGGVGGGLSTADIVSGGASSTSESETSASDNRLMGLLHQTQRRPIPESLSINPLLARTRSDLTSNASEASCATNESMSLRHALISPPSKPLSPSASSASSEDQGDTSTLFMGAMARGTVVSPARSNPAVPVGGGWTSTMSVTSSTGASEGAKTSRIDAILAQRARQREKQTRQVAAKSSGGWTRAGAAYGGHRTRSSGAGSNSLRSGVTSNSSDGTGSRGRASNVRPGMLAATVRHNAGQTMPMWREATPRGKKAKNVGGARVVVNAWHAASAVPRTASIGTKSTHSERS